LRQRANHPHIQMRDNTAIPEAEKFDGFASDSERISQLIPKRDSEFFI
jgi:hypothetical protein